MNTSKKNVVLGVTGGIAAYKAADLTSRLVKKRHKCGCHNDKGSYKFYKSSHF